MKERGMLFNDDMVRAIDADRKTVTRRTQGLDVLNLNMPDIYRVGGYTEERGRFGITVSHGDEYEHSFFVPCPFGKPGDRLYVREAHAKCEMTNGRQYAYRAAGDIAGCQPWTPSIHMPRTASRILLEITSVRAERLQDINEDQAQAEGCFFTEYGRQCGHTGKGWTEVGDCPAPEATHQQRNGWMWKDTTSSDQCLGSARWAFANLWNATGGDWDGNPWVWAVEFKKVTAES